MENLRDLTPLREQKLTHITLPPNGTKGMDGVRAMATLHSIDGMSPKQFWEKWDAQKKKVN
jgi:hypothetical protein